MSEDIHCFGTFPGTSHLYMFLIFKVDASLTDKIDFKDYLSSLEI